MQISIIAQFPLEFTCADCGQTVAMIDQHKTIDEDSGEKVVTEGFYTLVIFPHDSGDQHSPVELVEKGTLAECLHYLSTNCLKHEAARKVLALLNEVFGQDNEVVFVPDSSESLSSIDEYNFPNLTRH